jgi:hypothetical protein
MPLKSLSIALQDHPQAIGHQLKLLQCTSSYLIAFHAIAYRRSHSDMFV